MTSNIAANLRHIAKHEAKPQPKELPYTQITRGFEAFAFPKIVRELKHDDLIVKQKSLLAARELLGSGTSYVQCIAAGIVPPLINLLQDPDAIVRERAAGTIQHIATKELGARDMIQHSGIPALVTCLEDEETKVRDAAYLALLEAARFNSVRSELVSLKTALPRLMSLVLKEEGWRSLQGLHILNEVVQVRNNAEALKQLVDTASAIPSLGQLISAEQSQDIQEQAAQLLGLATSNFDDAKLEAVQVGCVPKLLSLLQKKQENVSLASAAATALMMITVVRDGKYAVVKASDGLSALVNCLDPQQEQLCVNVSQCITNVAEAPEARPILKECGAMDKLLSIHQGEHPEIVRRGAAEALRQNKFLHLPYEPLPGRTVSPQNFPAAEISEFKF